MTIEAGGVDFTKLQPKGIYPKMTEFNLRQYLKKNFVGVFVFRATGAFLAFLIGVVLARLLGASNYGIYAYVMAWIAIITFITQFGFENYLPRETANYHVASQWTLLKGLLARSHQIVFVLSVIAVLVGEYLLWLLRQYDSSMSIHAGQIGLLLLPFLSLSAVRGAFLQGLRRVNISQLPEQILSPFLFLIIIFISYFLFKKMNYSPAIMIGFQIVCAFIAFFAGGLFLKWFLPSEVKNAKAEYKTVVWSKTAFAFLLLNSASLIYSQTGIVLLGILKDSQSVGVFNIVTSLSIKVAFIASVFNAVIAPIIAQLYAQKSMDQLQRLVSIGARFVSLLTLPIVVGLLLGGHWFLAKIYGPVFGALGSEALCMMAVSQLINALIGPVVIILYMTGYEKEALRIIVISMFINVIFNMILIPTYGINGAAIASFISTIYLCVAMHVKIKQKMNINTLAFNIWN